MKRKPSTDQAQAAVDELGSHAKTWPEVKKLLPTQLAEAADVVVRAGGMSLLDVQALEYADHVYLTSLLQRCMNATGPEAKQQKTLISGLIHARIQSRKHMRTLAHLMNPVQHVGDTRPALPPEVAAKYNAIYDLPDDDYGDELIN
jgi:hypothetical protein